MNRSGPTGHESPSNRAHYQLILGMIALLVRLVGIVPFVPGSNESSPRIEYGLGYVSVTRVLLIVVEPETIGTPCSTFREASEQVPPPDDVNVQANPDELPVVLNAHCGLTPASFK